MKNLRFNFSIILLLLCSVAFGQKEISVISITKQMSRGMQPGFQVNVPEGKLKEVTSALKKQLQQNTKVDAKEVAGEIVSYGVMDKNFSLKPFIIYCKLLETTEGVELTVFVTEDSLTFISDSSNADKIAAIKKSLHDFSVTEYKKIITKKLEIENDKLETLNKDLNKKRDAESDNTKSISKKQREIESYQSKIETSKKDQIAAGEKIQRQQKLVDDISDKNTPEYNMAVSNLKNYQGDKKSMEKESEKMGRNIDDNKADVKTLEHKNEDLKKQQDDVNEKIKAQQDVVRNLEKVLGGIK